MNKRFAIIGFGFISPRHVEAIKAIGGKIVYVVDPDESVKEKMPEGAIWLSDYKQVSSVDWVSICAPNYLHAPMIRHFLAQQVRILVEKPPVISLKDMQQLKDKRVNVVLQLRYHPAYQALKEAAKGENHRIELIVNVKRDPSYWDGWKGNDDLSGGILFNLGIHYIDAVLSTFSGGFKILEAEIAKDRAIAWVKLGSNRFYLDIKISPDNSQQTREIIVDGKSFQFSKQDNLSFEGLHTKVYEHAVDGRGLLINECERSVGFIEMLKTYGR